MRESRTPGSVRGVLSNEHPYRDSPTLIKPSGDGYRFTVCGNLRQSLSFYKEATGAAAPPAGLFIQSVEVPPVSPSSSCSIPTATSSRSTARRSSRKPVLKCSPKRFEFHLTILTS